MDPSKTPNQSQIEYLRTAKENPSGKQHEEGSTSGPTNDNIQNDGQPQYAEGYTVIPPNESRRSKLQRTAQKEEEDLQRWREEHKYGPVNLPPAKLGGAVSLADARQKQFVDLRQSKLQKKLKQEDMERKKKEAAEEENRKMKAIQREKAIKLEEKKHLEDQQRKEQFRQDQQLKTQQFLQKFERSSPMTASSSLPASSWPEGAGAVSGLQGKQSSWDFPEFMPRTFEVRVKEYQEAQRAEEEAHLMQMKEKQRMKSVVLEEKQKQLQQQQERDMDTDRRRVNTAFLDKLEGNNRSCKEVQQPQSALVESDSEDHRPCEFQIPTASPRIHLDQVPNISLQPDPPQLYTGKTEGGEQDHEWAVMKLLSRFPNCERGFLQEIVSQCNGDYKQACSLLE